ncbi:MAG TPA: 4'-phosphopantetheinyl transferase superfamily protein [Acidimicrobiales bacterium]|nr:4'-phosphopantetheinyl transferase superfamily protein [Acidimicrobiales bacterium]
MRVEWQTALLGPALPNGEVHLWTAQVGDDPRNMDVLSEDEETHAATFRFEEDRWRWVTSRALLRLVLGRYLGSDPRLVEFATVTRGRRIVRRPESSEWLSFSQARSGELCVVVVTRRSRIGVDLERVTPDHEFVAVARRALGDDLAARLATLPHERRIDEFYRAWVCEEARGKCRGTGLVEPDDAARRLPLFVTELTIGEGYAGALASDTQPDAIRGHAAEL